MTYQSITYSVTNRVATITLNRPEAMNAIHHGMRMELADALAQATNDNDVAVLVLAANGRGFSAGTDLQEIATKPGEPRPDIYGLLEEEYKPLVQAIMECPKPVVAAINGVCAGIGASLALACDLSVMAESSFIYLAFANIGLIPDGGMCWQLVHAIGYRRAYQVVAEGGRLTAQQCLAWGLANKVSPDDQLLQQAQEWAEQLSRSAPLTLKFAKQTLQQAQAGTLADNFRIEAGLQGLCATTEDFQEGLKAFQEKRKPVFSGR